MIITTESPIGVLKTIPGWETLNQKDQNVVERETRGILEGLLGWGRSRLAIGEHLSGVQSKLEPKRMFGHFLKAANIKRSWAYEQILAFQNASKLVPKPVLEAAMMRNMSLLGHKEDKPLGVYTNAFKRIPPPATNDPKKIHEYLDSLEESRKRIELRGRIQDIEEDPEILLKQSYRFVMSRLNKLPNRGRSRKAFVDSLVGMVMSEIGVSGSQSFEPEAVPDGFRAEVGRPKLAA